MKRTVLAALLSVLLLSACTTAQAPPEAGSPNQSTSKQVNLQAIGQEAANDAYNAILNSFNAPLPHEPGYPGYPEEFADAYLADGLLHICLTDDSEEMRKKYLALVDIPNSIQFHLVEHSYNDLHALLMAAIKTEGLEFSGMGINVITNRVEVGIPDLSKENEARTMILEQLSPEVAALFDDPPLFFVEYESATVA